VPIQIIAGRATSFKQVIDWIFGFGYYLEFGIWDLGFGILSAVSDKQITFICDR
jgi:hypothetical protein